MMKNRNIETDFIKFIIDKYSPKPGATASENDSQKDSNDEDEEEDEKVIEGLLEFKNIKARTEVASHKIQMLNDRINANRKKLSVEKDSKKRQILNLQIWIDQYQIRMTQLKS
jgi:predicted  nucleic acid-binding Zn-ribbon protein